MAKTRILVVEDNRLLREGLTDILNAQTDMTVAETLGSGHLLLLRIAELDPEVVLLDVGLGSFKDSSLVSAIRNRLPGAKVIGMGFIPTQSDIVEFIEAGASGFILKDATVTEFLQTIRTVAQGGNVLPPTLTESLFSQVLEGALQKKEKIDPGVRMTQREKEIIALIADGLSNKEIAQRLNIATFTVKSHVHNIMEKLALHSRLQIAAYNQAKDSPES